MEPFPSYPPVACWDWMLNLKKNLDGTFFFSRAGFPPWKVPVATCTACLTVINRVYRITVNHPLSFVLSNKCAKNNASVTFCVSMEMKCVCLTLHSEGLMFLVPVNTIAAAMWVLVCRSFGFSAVTRTSAASRSDGGGGWGGVLWSVHSNLYFFSLFCLVWLTFLFKTKNWIKLIYLLRRFTLQIILLLI